MLNDRREQKSRIGDIVEHRATVWLLGQGYEVFNNVSCIGPLDKIVLDSSGKVFKVDVKKCTDASRNDSRINHPVKTDEQLSLDVQFLYYDEVDDCFAWSLEEIYNNKGKPYRKKIVKSKKEKIQVTIDKEFKSLPEAARHYGVHDRSLRERQRVHPTETLEMSINALLNNSKKVIIFGTTYGNRAEACRQLGINPSSVEERMRAKRTNLEETIQHFLDRNIRRKENKK